MNESELNMLMMTVNGALVFAAMGIAAGYTKLSGTRAGSVYLRGNWVVNEQKFDIRKGNVLFFIVESTCLLSGLVLSLIAAYFIPNYFIDFVVIAIGSFVSGYVYTSKTCQILNKYKIIIEV